MRRRKRRRWRSRLRQQCHRRSTDSRRANCCFPGKPWRVGILPENCEFGVFICYLFVWSDCKRECGFGRYGEREKELEWVLWSVEESTLEGREKKRAFCEKGNLWLCFYNDPWCDHNDTSMNQLHHQNPNFNHFPL